MSRCIVVITVLLVAIGVSVVAQENNESGINIKSGTDFESNQPSVPTADVQSSTNFVKDSNDFTQTPYFPLLLGLAPYAATAVVGVPLVLAGTPQVLSFGLLGAANPDYLDTLNSLVDITATVYDISASVAAITLPIGVVMSYVVNLQYLYFGREVNDLLDVVELIGLELMNTTMYFMLGFVWIDSVDRFAENTDIDIDVDVFVDGVTVGIITSAVYLATSVAKGIIFSAERSDQRNQPVSKTTTDWRVQPTLNGVEAVYSY